MSDGASFKKRTIENILLQFFKDEKTKLNAEALLLLTELMKIFVKEATMRSIKEAKKDYLDQVTIDYFEKILPQLMLDF